MIRTLHLVIVLAVTAMQARPTMNQNMEKLTGANSVDCGTFSILHNGVALPIRPSSKATNRVDSMRESLACAEQALKDRKGFTIVQRGQAHDVELSSGVLGTANGRTLWFISQNSGPLATTPCLLTDITIEPTSGSNRTHLFNCRR